MTDDFDTIWRNVVEPFCAKAAAMPYSAILLVRNKIKARLYSCQHSEGSDWFDLPLSL